jgi:sucrose-6-phosphate hydrolase SacC (GH32 family)
LNDIDTDARSRLARSPLGDMATMAAQLALHPTALLLGLLLAAAPHGGEAKLCAGVSDMVAALNGAATPTLDGIWDAPPLCAGLEATRPLPPGGNSYAITDGPYTGNGDLGLVLFPEDGNASTYFAHDLAQFWTPQAQSGQLTCGYGLGGKRSVGMAKLTRTGAEHLGRGGSGGAAAAALDPAATPRSLAVGTSCPTPSGTWEYAGGQLRRGGLCLTAALPPRDQAPLTLQPCVTPPVAVGQGWTFANGTGRGLRLAAHPGFGAAAAMRGAGAVLHSCAHANAPASGCNCDAELDMAGHLRISSMNWCIEPAGAPPAPPPGPAPGPPPPAGQHTSWSARQHVKNATLTTATTFADGVVLRTTTIAATAENAALTWVEWSAPPAVASLSLAFSVSAYAANFDDTGECINNTAGLVSPSASVATGWVHRQLYMGFSETREAVAWASAVVGAGGATVAAAAASASGYSVAVTLPRGGSFTVSSSLVTAIDVDYAGTETARAVARASALASEAERAQLAAAHRAWWRAFWREAAAVSLPSAPITEAFWSRTLYVIACSRGNDRTRHYAQLWKNTWLGDYYGWGAYTTNQNTQAGVSGVQAANVGWMAEPFFQLFSDWGNARDGWGRVNAAMFKSKNGTKCGGIHVPCNIGPRNSLVSGDMFSDAGQHSNAAWNAMLFIERYELTRDIDWLRSVGYAFVRGVGEFWECFLKEDEGGVLQSVNDCANENCYISPLNGAGGWSQTHRRQDSNPASLGFIVKIFTSLLRFSADLGVDAEQRALWEAILRKLAPYPTVATANSTLRGREIITLFNGAPEMVGDQMFNPAANIFPVWPAGAITLSSSAALQTLANNTLEWLDLPGNNAFQAADGNSVGTWIAAGRMAFNSSHTGKPLWPTLFEAGLAGPLVLRANGWTSPQLGQMLLLYVSELLLQSHEDFVRLFPGVPAHLPAGFERLRAKGAFLVSASRSAGGVVSGVAVRSERGQEFALLSPWPNAPPIASCGGKTVQVKKRSDLGTGFDRVYSFPTANLTCTITAGSVERFNGTVMESGVAGAASSKSDDAAAAIGNCSSGGMHPGVCLHDALPILRSFGSAGQPVSAAACCGNCTAEPRCMSWNINTAMQSCFLRGSFKTNPGKECVSGCVRGTCRLPPPLPAPPPPAPPPSPCVDGNGTHVPCSRTNQRCAITPPQFPVYHIHDRGGCGNNDVNAPFYDPRFGLYHVMFQEHISLPNGGVGAGPVFGHVVSWDLVHWARLEVAIWNDQPYDDVAIYTGSATIVNGTPTIVYPGLCAKKPEYPQCDGSQDHCHLAVAVPANGSDPLCRNWTKPSFNPIVNSTQRDPSGAWRTPAGEWQMVTIDEHIYASMDFESWEHIGTQSAWKGGECQSFFPRPRSTPGSGPAPPPSELPTHFHKSGGIHDGDLDSEGARDGGTPVGPPDGGDWYAAGIYTPGPPQTIGGFQMLHYGNHGDADYQCLNHGDDSYAAKDFEAGKGGRRINLYWANLGPSCLTLPRELTWDNELRFLVQAPLPEMELLRDGPALAVVAAPTVVPSSSAAAGPSFLPLNVLDGAGASRGRTLDIEVTFARPGAAGRFGVVFCANRSALSNASNSGMLAYVDYVPNASRLAVGVIDGGSTGAQAADKAYAAVMPGMDLPNLPNLQTWYKPADNKCDPTDGNSGACWVSYSDHAPCRASCEKDAHCLTWTFTAGGRPEEGGPPHSATCTKRTGAPVPVRSSVPGIVSGLSGTHMARGDALRRRQGVENVLRMSPRDTNVTLRVFVDGNIAEVFWQWGRVAQTVPVQTYLAPVVPAAAAAAVVSDGRSDVVVLRASVFAVGGAWVSPEEVLRHAKRSPGQAGAGGAL